MFSSIKSISFDVANTLIFADNWNRNYREISNNLVRDGYEIYPQELEAARNYVFFWDFPKLGISNWKDWGKQILNRLGIENPKDQTVDILTRELKKISQSFKLFEDVEPVLKQLKANNFSISVVTTIPEFKLNKVLAPIKSYLDIIVTGGNAGCAKGNPKMYKFDLNSKMVQPSENLFVGDDKYLDIEIPKKMGQKTMQIFRNGIPPGAKHADANINTIHGILSWLDI